MNQLLIIAHRPLINEMTQPPFLVSTRHVHIRLRIGGYGTITITEATICTSISISILVARTVQQIGACVYVLYITTAVTTKLGARVYMQIANHTHTPPI